MSRLIKQKGVFSFVDVRHFSRICPPKPVGAAPIIKVTNNIARLEKKKEGPLPRQLMSLPAFPVKHQPLPGKIFVESQRKVTAVTWIRYYFHEIDNVVLRNHFDKGLVKMKCMDRNDQLGTEKGGYPSLKKIGPQQVMNVGDIIFVPVSLAESKVSKRYGCMPSGTLYPNADEIEYLQRLVMFKDSKIMVLNKPPKMPLTGNLPVHNSMDALAAAALCYGYEEGPKLVHRLDRESSGILLMGRTKDSVDQLLRLFSNATKEKLSHERYWALVIGSPKEKEGVIRAPLSKVLLDEGRTERVIVAHPSGVEASQEAITEYRVMGPTVNGCSWIELCPLTGRKHQLRVHCAEVLGTPIVGDYKYGWYVHTKWKSLPRGDIEPSTGKPYKMRRATGLEVQKGSVLSKVPLLHLHCKELILPNIGNFRKGTNKDSCRGEIVRSNIAKFPSVKDSKMSWNPDMLRFVAPMPSHMKISWNLMASYLV